MSGYGTGSSTVTLGSDPSCGPTAARTAGLRCTGNTTRTSGLAVANILRALTDLRLLKRSVGQLFSGIGVGTAIPLLMEKLGDINFEYVIGSRVFITDAGRAQVSK